MAAEQPPERAEGVDQPSTAPTQAAADARDGGERYGPLLVARHRKDDGRALILYSLTPEPDVEGA